MTPHEIYLSSPITQRWLRRLEPPAPLTPEEIIKRVCSCLNVSVDKVKSKTRKREVVQVRQLCMLMIKRKTSMSLKSISEIFNRSDHTAVIHASQVISGLVLVDEAVRSDYQKVCVLLGLDPELPKYKRVQKMGRPPVKQIPPSIYSNKSYY